MKSIVFISGGLAGGGQESAMVSLANAFCNQGHDVSIICLYRTDVYFQPDNRIKIYWPPFERRTTNKLSYTLKLFLYLRNALKTTRAKNVISFGDWFNAFTIIASLGLGRNVVITNRMGPGSRLSKAHEILNGLTYKWAAKLVVQTDRAKDIQSKRYRVHHIEVVPNGIDLPPLEGLLRGKSFLAVGRLSPEKGQLDLLKAYAEVNDRTWSVHLVGEGPMRKSCEEFVKQHGLGQNVIFYGHQTKLTDFYQKAGIFVLPSHYEGFPNALLEAMANGCCTIASDCIAGPSELITDGLNGNLYPPGDVSVLAAKLMTLIKDSDLRDEQGAAARKRAQDFSKINQLRAFDQLLVS